MTSDRSYRDVSFSIKHIHDRRISGTTWNSTIYKTSYGTFSATVAVPVNGLKKEVHQIYCPYCSGNVKLWVGPDKFYKLRKRLAIGWFVFTTLGGFFFGMRGEGFALGIGCAFLCLVAVGCTFGGAIEGHQFVVGYLAGNEHQIESPR